MDMMEVYEMAGDVDWCPECGSLRLYEDREGVLRCGDCNADVYPETEDGPGWRK